MAQLARILMLLSSLALGIEIIAWEGWLAPLHAHGSMLVLLALPSGYMLFCAWSRHVYGLQICSMLVLIYLAEGVVRATTDTGRSAHLALLELVLVLLFFVADLAYLAPLKRAARARAKRS